MFSKLRVAFAIAIAMGIAVSADECTSGPVQCCNSVETASPATVGLLSGILGILVPVGTNIGVTCSPITGIGAGTGSTCQSQTVCCENNTFNGIIAIGCSPINIIV